MIGEPAALYTGSNIF